MIHFNTAWEDIKKSEIEHISNMKLSHQKKINDTLRYRQNIGLQRNSAKDNNYDQIKILNNSMCTRRKQNGVEDHIICSYHQYEYGRED